MNTTLYSITYLTLSTMWLTTLSAEDVSTRIVDGLGRPLSGVVAEVKWSERRADLTTGRQLKLLTLRSAENGVVQGSFEHAAIPGEGSITIEFSKEGYGENIPSLGFLPNYISERASTSGPFNQSTPSSECSAKAT